MRFQADEPIMETVLAVLVTCPHCKYRKKVDLDYVLSVDDEQGLVEVMQPVLPTQHYDIVNPNPTTDDPKDTGEIGFEVVVLEGKVDILYRKDDE